MTRAMFRHEIPVDNSWHTIILRGPIRHIAARDHRAVEVWAENDPGAEATKVTFFVVGTGHAWPNDDSVTTIEWAGTALAPHGLVWHLLRQVYRHPVPNIDPSPYPAGVEPR